ncbi:MAG: peptidoglycan bridge formation glycyltransferase FemA/FemB family protein [Proteobacteria bacterium]|nr:peptidoglycan bridge formation glycyltransferase FemA/FemB family protein [Pseudomonadota bacterium]
MDLQIINPINFVGWDSLVLEKSGYSFFHSSAWARVLSEAYHYNPVYFVLFDSGHILALIPLMEVDSKITGKRAVSLPFTDYCEPIFDNPEQLNVLFNAMIDHGKRFKWRYLELRGAQDGLNYSEYSERYLHHFLTLSRKEESIFTDFRKGTKSAIHKAAREGVEVKILNSMESVRDFYKLNCITRKRHGIPPQPYFFFKKLHEHVISKNMGFVALASFRNNYIAGAMFVNFGEEAMYKYAASYMEFQCLRANNLILWEAIRWYCQRGYKTLSLGRTEPENEGLRKFKTGWGATEKEIGYYRYNLMKNTPTKTAQKVGKFNHFLFSKMPIPVLKSIGSLLYKHIG